MNTRIRMLVNHCALTIVMCFSASTAGAAAIVSAGAGLAAATAARNTFRIQLGGGTVASVNGLFNGTRREVNWDGVPDASSAPNLMPPNFFNVNSPRGLLLSTPGTGFQVSADVASGTPVRFGNINPAYVTTFNVFSPERLFSPIGSNVTDVAFVIPGTAMQATISGFGAMFTDVDNANVTSMQFFDAANVSLGTFFVPPMSGDVSFLGVHFNVGERIWKVRITTGTAALGPSDGPPVTDVVAMDDFIYSEPQLITQSEPPARIYAYERNTQRLISFLSHAPGIILTSVSLAGLQPTDQVIGIDFRPSTGGLYAVVAPNSGTSANVVSIDRNTGATSLVGSSAPLTFSPGAGHGMSFNPVSGRIRLVSDAGLSKRLSADNGALVGSDPSLAFVPGDSGLPGTPRIPHVAYTNHYFGATQTTLYGIDVDRGTLVMIGSPNGLPSSANSSQVTTIGPLRVTASTTGGFDIHPGTRTAYAVLRVGTASYLYGIDLTTGAASSIGLIGDGSFAIDGVAVLPASPCLDVDGDGRTDALTDALLLLRAMFGITGTAAISEVTSSSSARNTWEAIRTHLNAHCGTVLLP